MEKRVLAFDFGASGGRAMLGIFDGNTIKTQEIHRFSNDPVRIGDTFYWDVYRLFYEIKQGISKAALSGGFDSIGIDTWGVDFGLIDADGNLMEAPIHYRDKRTVGMVDKAFELYNKDDFYMSTGIQFMELNTVFQLLSLKQNRSHILKNADKILLMPDLFNYFLSGNMKTEMSIASTTQMLNPYEKTWSEDVLKNLGIPSEILTDIVPSGTVIGKLRKDICDELNAPQADIIAVCGHDTQCAVFSAPVKKGEDFIFISCGTWSLFGTEMSAPLINEISASLNLTNETGFGNTTTFLKNIIGLWLIQESRRQFKREGNDYSFAELEVFAKDTKPFACFINPDAKEFTPEGDIPSRVKEFCRRTGQYVPQTVGEIMRCIYESLALKYRQAFDEIRECTKKEYTKIHLVGGGTKDGFLCQMTANACGCEVIAGPIEATAYGNIAIQLIRGGVISDIHKAREIIAKSDNVMSYLPNEYDLWDKAYNEYKKYQK